MKENRKPNSVVLGIDTSNYTTSVALTDKEGHILADERQLLPVHPGQKGIRQSEAHFQHIQVLPTLIQKAFQDQSIQLEGVAVSARPRPVQGSYMPVFTAGASVASSIASAMQIPCFEFSHQEGHIQAVKYYSALKEEDRFIALHLSGGTCEVLKLESNEIEIIGGSKDLSFGQLIDRLGVALGLPFPSGPFLEKIAEEEQGTSSCIKPFHRNGLWFNLSGQENQLMKNLGQEGLARELFEKIGLLLIQVLCQAREETGIPKILFAGGVSENNIIRQMLINEFGENAQFGEAGLSSDNGVGISLLGGQSLWQ